MPFRRTNELIDGIVKGLIPYEKEHKFGRASIGTSFVPVCFGGLWQTPQVSGATALRIAAGGSANDTAAGSGAREVTLVGIGAGGAPIENALATAGASASSDSADAFLRLLRIYVSASGTYATQSAGSHDSDIVIENAAGTANWGTLDSTDYPRSQSEIACYTVPLGKTAFVTRIGATVDTTKTTDLIFYQRRNILQTAAPYSAARMILNLTVARDIDREFAPMDWLGPYPALTDLGFLAQVSATTSITEASFGLIVVDA